MSNEIKWVYKFMNQDFHDKWEGDNPSVYHRFNNAFLATIDYINIDFASNIHMANLKFI